MIESGISFVLASEAPKKLAEFYAFAMNAEVHPGLSDLHWLIVHPDGTRMQIYYPSQSRPLPKRGRALALCITGPSSIDPIASLEEWSLKLISRGAIVVEEPRLESFGAEAWLSDPEGNDFLILVPTN